MLSIKGNRECFFQWDLNQQLIVNDDAVIEVHFCNKTDDCALVVEVKTENGQRVADVPNILLQTAFDVRAYAYVDKYTKKEHRFKVKGRSKPADYIYTETEVKNYEQFAEDVDQLKKDMAAVDGKIEEAGNKNEWRLIAELIVEEHTKNLMVDFGAPIENWYSETMVHLYAPVNADNTVRLKSHIQFGDTEADANTPWNEGWGVILDVQNDNYGGISHSVLVNAAFTTQWVNREKAVYTDLRYTGFGAVCYPQNMFGCAINTEGRNNWTIKNKRFMSFRSRDNAFVFPKGTILRFYGRG